MSKRITKKFNSKFYGIDFYGYEHINKVSEKEPINCELRGQITKEIVKKELDLDDKAYDYMFPMYDFSTKITEEDKKGFERTKKFMLDNKMIEKDFDINLLFK